MTSVLMGRLTNRFDGATPHDVSSLTYEWAQHLRLEALFLPPAGETQSETAGLSHLQKSYQREKSSKSYTAKYTYILENDK